MVFFGERVAYCVNSSERVLHRSRNTQYVHAPHLLFFDSKKSQNAWIMKKSLAPFAAARLLA